MSILIVENDSQSRCEPLLHKLGTLFSGTRIQHVLETDIGIPTARNRAVREALAWGADWIIFIDDDEIADRSWLENIAVAMTQHPADVLHGPVRLIYPDDTPAWKRMKTFDGGADGTLLQTAATNNTAAKAWIFSRDNANLNFSQKYRFTGGGDIDLFNRARKSGAVIRWVADAAVYENVVPERLTDTWILQRFQRIASNSTAGWISAIGIFPTWTKVLSRCFRLFLEIVSTAAFLPLAWHNGSLGKYLFKIKVKFRKLIGYVQPLLGLHVEPYRNIEGY